MARPTASRASMSPPACAKWIARPRSLHPLFLITVNIFFTPPVSQYILPRGAWDANKAGFWMRARRDAALAARPNPCRACGSGAPWIVGASIYCREWIHEVNKTRAHDVHVHLFSCARKCEVPKTRTRRGSHPLGCTQRRPDGVVIILISRLDLVNAISYSTRSHTSLYFFNPLRRPISAASFALRTGGGASSAPTSLRTRMLYRPPKVRAMAVEVKLMRL